VSVGLSSYVGAGEGVRKLALPDRLVTFLLARDPSMSGGGGAFTFALLPKRERARVAGRVA
jgi:hypothetical protein